MGKVKHALLQFFAWGHLPLPMQEVSRPFGELAAKIDDTLPDNPEKTVALRKLLEAKDCAVRAVIWQGEQLQGPAPDAVEDSTGVAGIAGGVQTEPDGAALSHCQDQAAA